MNDTSPKVAELYRRLLMARSGEERMMMGFSMYDSARGLVEASLRDQGLVEGSTEWRRALLIRFYGDELRPEVIERIAAWRPGDGGISHVPRTAPSAWER